MEHEGSFFFSFRLPRGNGRAACPHAAVDTERGQARSLRSETKEGYKEQNMIREFILSVATIVCACNAMGDAIYGVTDIYPSTGGAKASLGAQFSIDDYTVTHLQVSSTSVSYQLYETVNSTSPLSYTPSWVNNLTVKYRTDSGAYGDVPKGYSRSLNLTSNVTSTLSTPAC